MKTKIRLTALEYAICQLVCDLLAVPNNSPLKIDWRGKRVKEIIPRKGLNVKVFRPQGYEYLKHGLFKDMLVARSCSAIITPVGWAADEFIECKFIRLGLDNKDKYPGWWPYRGLITCREFHREFFCIPNPNTGRIDFIRPPVEQTPQTLF